MGVAETNNDKNNVVNGVYNFNIPFKEEFPVCKEIYVKRGSFVNDTGNRIVTLTGSGGMGVSSTPLG